MLYFTLTENDDGTVTGHCTQFPYLECTENTPSEALEEIQTLAHAEEERETGDGFDVTPEPAQWSGFDIEDDL